MKIGRREFIKTFLLGFASVSIYGYLEPIRIEVNEVHLKSEFDKKILFITDTHFHGVKYLDELTLKTISRNLDDVDIILLGGDQYDEFTPNLDVMKPFLELLSNYEVYYVNGNHEHWARDKFSLKEAEEIYSSYGIESLNNTSIWVDNLKIGGVDWIEDNGEVARAYTGKVGKVDLLVSHTPDTFGYVADGYEIMLAGHTHGGQIFTAGLFTNSRFGYVSGLYREDNRVMYLSRGMGEILPFRFLSPRELTIVYL